MEENEAKKDKKSPKKKKKTALIIIAALIVAAAASFAVVKIVPPDCKLNLMLKFIKETHILPVKFCVEDYDINYENEAFAFTGKKKKGFIHDGEMWFVSIDKCEKITDIGKGKVNDVFSFDGRKASKVYISVEKYDGEAHHSLIYTADSETGTYSESVKSGRYRDVSFRYGEPNGYGDNGAQYDICPDIRGCDCVYVPSDKDYRHPVPSPELIEANEWDFEEAEEFITSLADLMTTEDFTKITEQDFFDKYFRATYYYGTYGSIYNYHHNLNLDEPIDYKKEPDPENRFKDDKEGLYYKYSTEDINWITSSIFNFKLSNYEVKFSDPRNYYYDGYYYMAPDKDEAFNEAYLISHEQMPDGKYKLYFEIYNMETNDLVSNLTLIAGLKESEGRNVWSLYSSEIINSK